MRFESETQHAPRSGLILLQVMVFALFCLFTLRFWYLQVHKGEQFAQKALDNQMRQVLIDSARGRVRDLGGRPVAVSEPSFALGLVREDCEDVEATLAKVAEWTGADPAALMEIYKRGKKRVKPFEPLYPGHRPVLRGPGPHRGQRHLLARGGRSLSARSAIIRRGR
jgi:penicillin-binding protein 2